MLVAEYEQIRREIHELADKYKNDPGSLIRILQAIQNKCDHIPGIAMQEIAYTLGIHPVEVFGVVTFYSFLHDKPQGHFIIRLCKSVSCDMQGKSHIARQLENDLGIKFGETTHDGMFTLEYANCMGMCDCGPALMANHRIYTEVTPEMVFDIIQECRKTFVAPELEDKGENR